jgi:hypothetical protein
MPADGMTKALPDQKHQKFVETIGLVDIKDLLKLEECQKRKI